MAPCPARLADSLVASGRRSHLRRTPRSPGGGDEPGRRAALDSLARAGYPRSARGRQRLLHGVPLPAAAHPRPPLAAGGLELAAATAEQMVGGTAARRLPVGLRGAGLVGPAAMDGVPGAGLL